ncbi:MAG: hypothetical protein GY828_05860 [Candidatus Gracilibacteria bacterium]|nr:hypothetical protein [Candidatus Gracilibacteria bacterium]
MLHEQSAPQFAGDGFVQLLVLVCVHHQHVSEHELYELRLDHHPFIGAATIAFLHCGLVIPKVVLQYQ